VDFSIDNIVASLPNASVLWEIVRYCPYDFTKKVTNQNRWGSPRYAAFALNSYGKIDMVDLGEAEVIDSLVSATQMELSVTPAHILRGHEQASEIELTETTRSLYKRVFEPLISTTAGVEYLIISPDGWLNLVPFEILPNTTGEYVIEMYQLSYLSSGRDLVKLHDRGENGSSKALVLAAPDYESTLNVTGSPFVAMSFLDSGRLRMRGPSKGTECLTRLFDPLPDAQTEGDAITALLLEKTALAVDYIHGPDASETRLKANEIPPRILHVATHAYYCSDARYSDATELVENPLLYSGLIMAGANRFLTNEVDPSTNTEDGILTSLEVSGLNLVGTELAVVSACRSGVGEVYDGEGVFGLRRAFQHAGARSLVTSMFAVPDESTSMLMQRFYENWLSGDSKSSALRNASLSILRERRENHESTHPLIRCVLRSCGEWRG
jgi:CHAT domain-containing protein